MCRGPIARKGVKGTLARYGSWSTTEYRTKPGGRAFEDIGVDVVDPDTCGTRMEVKAL
jgi:hypothetical protein